MYKTKEELKEECRTLGLPVSGSKEDLIKRLTAGNVEVKTRVKGNIPSVIADDTLIEENIVCSQKHREYFESKLGKSFSFKVSFQKWLKENNGKTYLDAVNAYKDVIKVKQTIDPQFEYNAYIKAFFSNNKGYTLSDAIKCWNYKKTKVLHPVFDISDLEVLKNNV